MKLKLRIISIVAIFTFSSLTAVTVTDESLPDPRTPDEVQHTKPFPPDVTPANPSKTIRSTDIDGKAGSGTKVKKAKKDLNVKGKKLPPIRDAE